MPLDARARAGLARRAARREERARADPRRAARRSLREPAVKLGVAFGWHSLAWEELVALVARAEELGFDTAYIDGDVSQLALRRDADVLDGWTATTALARAHAADPDRLDPARAALERRAPRAGRRRPRSGSRPGAATSSRRSATAARTARGACRSCPRASAWRGSTRRSTRCARSGAASRVTRRGRFVTLEGARVRPLPPGGRLPIEVGREERAPARRWSRVTRTSGT